MTMVKEAQQLYLEHVPVRLTWGMPVIKRNPKLDKIEMDMFKERQRERDTQLLDGQRQGVYLL